MNFEGFTEKDFDAFTIGELDPRMEAIQERIQPKFQTIGEELADKLSALTGNEMFLHIARHARRTKNPPESTWMAFSDNKRGYKKWPHFQVGLWETHLFIWFVVINEAENKTKIAKTLGKHRKQINSDIPDKYVWSTDHTEPDALPQKEADLDNMLNRLKNVNKAEVLCGQNIERGNPILKDGAKLLNEIETTFETVLPLYQWAKEG